MDFQYLCESEIKSRKILKIVFMERSELFTSLERFSMYTNYLSNQNKVVNIPTNMFSASTCRVACYFNLFALK